MRQVALASFFLSHNEKEANEETHFGGPPKKRP